MHCDMAMKQRFKNLFSAIILKRYLTDDCLPPAYTTEVCNTCGYSQGVHLHSEVTRELEENLNTGPCLTLSSLPVCFCPITSHQDKSRRNSENSSIQKHLPEGSNIKKTVLEHSESQPSPLQCPQPVTQSRSLREDTKNRYYVQHMPWVLSKASQHVSETS